MKNDYLEVLREGKGGALFVIAKTYPEKKLGPIERDFTPITEIISQLYPRKLTYLEQDVGLGGTRLAGAYLLGKLKGEEKERS